jgi:L-lactate dehydrogenase complex protein LldE
MSSTIKLFPSRPTKVYLYGTCLVNSFAPESGLDAIALLEAEGIEVIYPMEQTCCGQPAYNSGYSEEALAVARSQMALFPEPWPIVILSGSCGGMMRKHYLELAPDDQEVARFAERIFEFSEFLVHSLNIRLNDQGAQQRVTLHTSCSGRRELGIHETGVSLLQQLQQVELVEQAYAAECCGFGGTFSVKQADISSAMAQDKARHISDTQSECFVSTDWGCMLNINCTLEHQKQNLRGVHLATYLRQRTLPEGN